jgi:hypothetical protein
MRKNLAESLNNVLQIIEGRCTDAGGDIHINPDNLEPFSEETAYLKERMGLEPFQAVLLAVIIQTHANGRCTVNKVAQQLGMSYLQLLSYSKELYALRDRWFIMIKDNNEIKVPSEVLNALMKDEAYEKPKVDGLSTKAIMRRIRDFMKNADDGQMSAGQLLDETEILIHANPETSFGKTCRKYLYENGICPQERLLFYIMAFMDFTLGIKVVDMGDVEDYISDEMWILELKDWLDTDSLSLKKEGIIEPSRQDGLMPRGCFSFNEEVEKELFADVNRPSSNLKIVDLKDMSDKPEKQLFYNHQEKTQIDRLGSLLSKDSLNKVYETMKSKGLRTGFICLFYGDPGTGKTETVYQLAKRTGRKILEADVAKLRNCYVGETEKNMRDLFDQYRIANTENELTPILFFNEADAILGKRMEGAVRAVDRMENSVQNILLQEMETFEGIMIATTNLLGNLDPAFERRFLFKVRFNKPELEPRSLIWKSQFPSLSEEEALSIAGEFPLSGGQIENVVRKYTIDSVLSGEDGGYDQLRQYCREETVSSSSSERKRIGFQ